MRLNTFLCRTGLYTAVQPQDLPYSFEPIHIAVQVSQYTPLTALRLGELALEAGVPPGVLNVLTGNPSADGSPLVWEGRERRVLAAQRCWLGT